MSEEITHYDNIWYEKLSILTGFSERYLLEEEPKARQLQKELFISDEITNPELTYPFLDPEQLSQSEAGLVRLKQELLEQEENPVVLQAYRWRINEEIARARMLQAAATGDSRRFSRYSEFLFGKPDPEIFHNVLIEIHQKAREALEDVDNPSLQEAAKDLLQVLPDPVAVPQISPPDSQTVSLAHEQVLKEFGHLLPEIDQEEFTAEEIVSVFSDVLERVTSGQYQAVIDTSSKTSIGVDHGERQLTVPNTRSVSHEKLMELIVHEIGTHIQRVVKGNSSRLLLLGSGLDRYTPGEEGVATMRAQALHQKADEYPSLTSHLTIGLIKGLDGSPRDFRQTFEILEKYFLFDQLQKGRSLAIAQEKAQKFAWNRCTRTFKGTDCKTPGTCLTRDLAYREGAIAVWQLISEDSQVMQQFSLGKYDPTNPRHLWVLSKLGLTENRLDTIEK